MRKILTLCISLIVAVAAQARVHELEMTETDSISTAMAAIWQDRIQQLTAGMSAAEKKSFKRGATLAVDSSRVNDPYVQGLEEGSLIYHRLQQAESAGGYTADIEVFRKEIYKALSGKSTGMTVSEAEKWLNDLSTRLFEGKGEVKPSKGDIKKASRALATLWGDYLRNKAAKDEPAIFAAYSRGLKAALDNARTDDAFLLGVETGVNAYRALETQERAGEYQLDMVRFRLAFDKMLNGRSVNFTTRSAMDYLARMEKKLADDDLAIENDRLYADSISHIEGIIKLPTGTMVQIVTEGEGESPRPDDLVLVNYTGRFANGEVFNKSEEGSPVVFSMQEVIPGFRDGLLQAKKGGTYIIYIPSEQGYGSIEVPGVVPPDAFTIFDVELIDLRHVDALAAPAE